MTDTDHIFTPKDDSLAERIRAYRSTREAWLNAEASLRHLDTPEWSDSLGERSEIEEAHEICKRSLEMASLVITKDDLSLAKEQGLLDDDELMEIVQLHNKFEMEKLREKSQKPDSLRHRMKR